MINSIILVVAEVSLFLLTMVGPYFFLCLVYASNIYLLLKPLFISTITWSSYKTAFAKARKDIARYWIWHGKFFHAHKFHGLENIPNHGPAVIVYFHGAIPIDNGILISTLLVERNLIIRSVVDRYFIRMPGLEILVKGFGFHCSSRTKCVEMLKQGHVLGVAPGGGYEAQLGSINYELLWKSRSGFAAIAVEAGNVPIIPVFTRNIRESYVNMQSFRRFFHFIFQVTKIPCIPLYGGFPVRLETFIGKPILTSNHSDVESVRMATVKAMENLISEHQPLPGSVIRGIQERINVIENPFPKHYNFVVNLLSKLTHKS